MESDTIIKPSLEFILTTNNKGVSFDYFDDNAKDKGYTTWLYKYYKELGIEEKSWDNLVIDMMNRGLIDSYPSFAKDFKSRPSQIKITKKGIDYLGKGNEEKIEEITEKSINKLQHEVLTLQHKDLKNKGKQRWIDFMFTAVGILLGVLTTHFLQSDHKTEVINQIQLPSQEVRITYDTIHIVYPKSPNHKK